MGAQIRFPFSNGVCNSDAKVQIGHTYMNCEFYTIVHKIAEKTECYRLRAGTLLYTVPKTVTDTHRKRMK